MSEHEEMKLTELEKSASCILKDKWQASYTTPDDQGKENVSLSGSWPSKCPALESAVFMPSKRACIVTQPLYSACNSLI
ncbi:hypothetical protein DFH29DRAFT_1009581 [Suillus ampliporus]|nr:hypothetical protein DFH29DRAFT_1009581 [Suillus ampliporus]